jgi:hypothetical protein
MLLGLIYLPKNKKNAQAKIDSYQFLLGRSFFKVAVPPSFSIVVDNCFSFSD